MVDVYHEFSHPYEMTEAMVKALKPGGRLVFVEFRLEDQKVPIKLVHKMSEKQVHQGDGRRTRCGTSRRSASCRGSTSSSSRRRRTAEKDEKPEKKDKKSESKPEKK